MRYESNTNTSLETLDEEKATMHEEEREVWVKEAPEEDNKRYKKFLSYMEERREEARERLREEEERK